MAYVPPSRRNAGQTATPVTRFYSLANIRSFIGSNHVNTLSPFPDTTDLCAIILYRDQHPQWSPARKIFCKSNLDVLRGSAVTEGQSFPVLTEMPFGRQFEFAGYFRVKDIQWLQPQSQELVNYLKIKFSPPDGTRHKFSFQGKERTEDAWKDSIERQWAVVTLEMDSARNVAPL